jgi:predicted  nucleic acid-binding Zn-ribbon protein
VYQNTELADAGIAERNCVQGERSRIYGPLESRSQQIGRQIAELNRQLAASSNNLAGATRDSGIRAQIASLQQSLSAERMAADTQMASARTVRIGRRERERSVRDKFNNVPAGTLLSLR